MSIDPDPRGGILGDTATTDVRVENVTDLYGFEFQITFEPTVVEGVQVQEVGARRQKRYRMERNESTLMEASCKNITAIRDLGLITLTAISALALSSAWRRWRELKNEIARLRRTEETVKRLAYHDCLTGLPNRRLFNDRLDVAIAYAQRNRHKLAMLLLDLDQFKDINDTLGHSVGDELLKAVSERLINLLRKSDAVARMGGDEFMLILPEMAREEDAAKVATKILNAFQDPFVFDGYELRITTSIGIAIYPHDGEDSDTLIKNADIAMYRAKAQGRYTYEYYNHEY